MATEKNEAAVLDAVVEPTRMNPDRLRHFFDVSLSLLCTADAATNTFVDLNPAWERALGWTLEELRSRPFTEFIHLDDLAPTFAVIADMVARGLPAVNFENRYRHKDGSWVWLSWHSVVRDGSFYASATDVTDKQRLLRVAKEARLIAEEASRAKTHFLAFMSHELRTPLTGILGMAQLLETTELSTAQREMVEGVVASGQRLLKIASDVLDLSRIDINRMTLEPLPFDLGLAIRDVVALFGARARARNVALHVDIAADVAKRVVGDAGRVQQVLTNLVDNATRCTDRGRIVVRIATASAGVLRFEVEDSGGGIEAADLEGIFDRPFATQRSQRGGTGLGLSICRRLVAVMGGTLGVTSTLGSGTSFRFELPLASAPPEPSAVAAVTAPVPRGRVLVVEDDAVSRRVAVLMLEHLGQQVTAVEDGPAAIAAAGAAGSFDLVVMDCNLPGMSGPDVATAIRSSGGAGASVPIVALGASLSAETRRLCLDAGMAEVLTKPINVEEMAGMLRRHAAAPA